MWKAAFVVLGAAVSKDGNRVLSGRVARPESSKGVACGDHAHRFALSVPHHRSPTGALVVGLRQLTGLYRFSLKFSLVA